MDISSRIILIVDGRSQVYADLERALAAESRASLSYTLVPTAAAARRFCQTNLPDAIVLADQLPDGDGLALLAELIAAYGELTFAIVMLVDAEREQIGMQARRLGADDYLIRHPDLFADMRHAVSRALEQLELRRQNAALQRQHPSNALAQPDGLLSQAVLDSLNDQIAVLDGEGTIRMVNAAWLRLGRQRGRVMQEGSASADIGVNYLAVCQVAIDAGEADAQAAYDGIRAVLAGRQARFTMEYRCDSPQAPAWFTMTISPLAGGNGVVAVHTDITARRQAENEMRRNGQLLKLFVEHTPATVAMFDRAMHYLAFSQRYLTDYRLGEQHLLGRSHYDVFPNLPERWKEFHRLCLAGASASADDELFPREDGTIDRVRWEIRPWYEDDATVGGLMLFSEVITARRKTEQALALREAQFAGIINTAMDAIITLDSDQRIAGWNLAAERMFGCPAADVLGQPHDRFLPERHRDSHRIQVREFGTTGDTARAMGHQRPLTALRADGTEFPIEASISRIDVEGQLFYTAIIRDISKRKRAEEALRISQAHQTFMLKVSDTLLPLSDPVAIQFAAVQALGEYLGLSRAGYAEDLGDGETIRLTRNYTDGVPGIEGVYRYDDYGPELLREFRVGRTVVRSDIPNNPTLTDAEKQAHSVLQLGATVNVPLVRNGRLSAVLFAHQYEARVWTPDEVALIEAVAARTWDAVERARAEAALRENEQQYRALFESIDEGVCMFERLPLRPDGLRDYRYISMNPAMQAMFGIPDLSGQSIRDNFPDEVEDWYDDYDRVLETGQSIRFERETVPQGMVLEMFVTRVEDGSGQRLLAVMQDITERKRREQNLAFLAELQDKMAQCSTAEELVATLGASLGAYLNIKDCVFTEIDAAHDQGRIDYCWLSEATPDLRGVYRLSDFISAELVRAMQAGETLVLHNIPNDPRVHAEPYVARNSLARIAVPFRQGDDVRWMLGVGDTAPRTWRDDEVELVTEVMSRTFPRIEHALAEAARRASDERFRAVIENSTEGVVLLNADDHVVYASPNISSILGYTPDEFHLLSAQGVIHPDDWAAVSQTRASLFATPGARLEHIARIRHKDGRWRWLERSIANQLDNPALHAVIVNFRDVTERVEAEAAQRTSDERFRAVIENSAEGVMLLDADVNITYASPTLPALLGYSIEEYNALAPQLAHPDDLPTIARLRSEIFATPGARADYIARIRQKDGSWRWVERSAINLLDNPALHAVVVNYRDITERVEAEQALRQSEQRFRKVFQASPVPIIISTIADGRIIDANPRFMDLMEYQLDEVIGKTSLELGMWVDPIDRALLVERIRHDQVLYSADVQIRTRRGEHRDVLLSVELIDFNGDQTYMLSLMYDVTERRHAEQQLHTSQQQLEDLSMRLVNAQEDERRKLAYELHDEIGQQLTGINMGLQTSERETSEQLHARLREVQQLINGLTSQVRQLSFDLRPAMLDTMGLLPTLRWYVERYIQQSGIVIDFKYSGLDIAIPDHSAITVYRIVQEGLTNIARHAQTAQAQLAVWSSGQQLKISIEDQGRGFDASATLLAGRSLGLIAMQERVRLLGGQFTIDSTPGEGTHIRVTLPLDTTPASTQ